MLFRSYCDECSKRIADSVTVEERHVPTSSAAAPLGARRLGSGPELGAGVFGGVGRMREHARRGAIS